MQEVIPTPNNLSQGKQITNSNYLLYQLLFELENKPVGGRGVGGGGGKGEVGGEGDVVVVYLLSRGDAYSVWLSNYSCRCRQQADHADHE